MEKIMMMTTIDHRTNSVHEGHDTLFISASGRQSVKSGEGR